MTQRLFLGFALTEPQTVYITTLQSLLRPALERDPSQIDTSRPQTTTSQVTPVSGSNLHLTLCFLGQVSSSVHPALLKAIDAMAKPRFTVTLDQLSHWPNAKVLCLSGHADGDLTSFATHAQLIASAQGLHRSEHVFTPHISLYRKAKNVDQARLITLFNDAKHACHIALGTPCLTLTPELLHLYESHSTATGVEYRVLQTWELD